MDELECEAAGRLPFVPEGRRQPTGLPIEMWDPWVETLLRLFTRLFGGGTAFGRGIGAWREGEDEDSPPHFDRVTVVETWIGDRGVELRRKLREVFRSMERMRVELREQEVACVLDGVFYVFGIQEKGK